MKRVLFVCVHNSARSQMAEAFLNKLGAGIFEAESAGLEPRPLNPLAVQVMREAGYDISRNPTNSVFQFLKEGRRYELVVKVCDEINGQKCPIFPTTSAVLNWNLADPSEFEGTEAEKLEKTRKLRDEIRARVESLIVVYS